MNLFSSRRGQLNLEKLLKSTQKSNHNFFKPSKKRVEEEKKIYFTQESKFNLKQILKHYSLYRKSLENGFTRKYINLFTDLLYESKSKNYSMKRLFLVDFRKNIIKKKLSLSFEDFFENKSLNNCKDRQNKHINNIYRTKTNSNLFNLKLKNKNINNKGNKTERSRNNKEISSINFLKKTNLLIKLEGSSSTKNMKTNNIPIEYAKNNNKSHFHTITSYNYKKNNEGQKYMWNANPKDELIEKNNKVKFIDYMNQKYDFYKYRTLKEKKNLKEIRERQIIFSNDRIKIKKKVEFPYKKEFFGKLNRLRLGTINKTNYK